MIKKNILAAVALGITLGACTSEELSSVAPGKGRMVSAVATIAAPSTDSTPQSRTSYTEWNETNNVLTGGTWDATEKASLYNDLSYVGEFSGVRGTADATTCTFTGMIPDSYYDLSLVYPAMTKNTLIDFTAQEQTGNGTLDHLKKYDYMKGTFNSDFSQITFKRQTAVIRVNINGLTALNDKAIAKISIKSKQDIFFKYTALNSGVPNSTCNLTITGDGTSIDKGKMTTDGKFTAYFTIKPIGYDLTNGDTFKFTVTDKEGKSYTSTKTFTQTTTFSEGKCYTLDTGTDWTEVKTDIALNSGTYEIYTARGLQAFSALVNGTAKPDGTVTEGDGFAEFGTAHADIDGKLINDIDLSSVCYYVDGTTTNDKSWLPIGFYTGKFDGNGKTVSGLYINSNGSSGLFGGFGGSGSWIKNLTVNGATQAGNADFISVRGQRAGILAGTNVSTIIACHVTGNVLGTYNAGGLTSENNGGTIVACSATGNATLYSTLFYGYAGGLVGFNHYSSYIYGCYATGNVNNQLPQSDQFIGGLVGKNEASTINYCRYLQNFGTYGVGKESGTTSNTSNVATIEALNTSTNIAALNAGITNWNTTGNDGSAWATTNAKYCNFHFEAGNPAATAPPTIVAGAPAQ